MAQREFFILGFYNQKDPQGSSFRTDIRPYECRFSVCVEEEATISPGPLILPQGDSE